VVDIIERHEAPILSMMTYVPPGRVDCELIVRVKTERVDSLIRDLKKAEFKVIYREVFPLVSKGKSLGVAKESKIPRHWWEEVWQRQKAA
jgi:hypothetical protein